MKIFKKILIASINSLCLAATASLSWAGSITLSGSDLLTYSGVTFPNGAPTQSGSSVIFESLDDFDKLFKLTLFPAGSLTGNSPVDVSISINLTRLTDDWDPHVVLIDGNFHNISIEAADNDGGELWAEHFTSDRVDQLSGRTYDALLFDGAGYPNIGESMTWDMNFLLGSNSSVETSFLGGSGTYSWGTSLNLDTDISLLFLQDNDPERNQINSLTISSSMITPIPEPETYGMFLAGLGLVGFMARRRKLAKV